MSERSETGNYWQCQLFPGNLLVKGSKEVSSSWQEIKDLFKLPRSKQWNKDSSERILFGKVQVILLREWK